MITNNATSCYSIDSQAIKANVTTIREHLPLDTKILAMIKANGYGTDMVQMAKLLQTCNIDCFGVAKLEEALKLREANITSEIFLFYPHPTDAKEIVENRLTACISDRGMAEALAESGPATVHLHIDTGMKRVGCPYSEAIELAKLPNLQLDGIFTHFAAAEDPLEDSFTLRQVHLFDQLLEKLEKQPRWRHAANSAGVARFCLPQYNMVRTGLALFGAYSSPEVASALPLKPALSLTSTILGIHHCKKGDSVGYGRTFTANKTCKIATVPLGYYDGIHRLYSNQGTLRIHNKMAPIVGTISMDALTVDVTGIPEAKPGDTVTFFDDQLPPESLATSGKTIMHELMTCIGPRIPRAFV